VVLKNVDGTKKGGWMARDWLKPLPQETQVKKDRAGQGGGGIDNGRKKRMKQYKLRLIGDYHIRKGRKDWVQGRPVRAANSMTNSGGKTASVGGCDRGEGKKPGGGVPNTCKRLDRVCWWAQTQYE